MVWPMGRKVPKADDDGKRGVLPSFIFGISLITMSIADIYIELPVMPIVGILVGLVFIAAGVEYWFPGHKEDF